MYKHQEDKPSQPAQGGKAENLRSMKDFKGQAMDQAYGQAGSKGCKSDEAKIKSQFFSGAYTSDSSGY